MEGHDAAVVEQVLNGDRDAFRALVERHSRTVFRLAYRMTRNEQDAEEVVQETFLRAYRRLSTFESRANFRTWLYRIAVNCSLDLKRARTQQEEVPLVTEHDGEQAEIQVASAEPGPHRMLLSAEVRRKLGAAMESLTATERAAFVLRHFEGQNIEEIARALNLREGAAKNSIFRAVQKLRRELAPMMGAAG